MRGNASRIKYSALNFITGLGGNLLTTLLKFITRTIFINTLGKSYLGINGYFADIMTMLSITDLGFATAINYRLYKPLAEKDDKTVRILLKFYKLAYRIIGGVIFGLGILLIPFLKYLIRDYESLEALEINIVLIFLLYLLQSVSTYLFFAYRSAIINADQHEYVTNISNYFFLTLRNIAQIIILLVWKNFIAYTAVIIIFNILENLVNSIIAKRMYPQLFIKEEESLSKDEVISMAKDCGALFAYRINSVVIKATDNMVLGAFIGMTMVGIYSNYLLMYTTIKGLLQKFYSACKASMGNIYATADVSKSYFFFEVMNFLSILLYGTAGIGVAVVADELISCWIGDTYVIPQPFALLVGIEILFVGIKFNLGQIRNISGAFRQMWYRPLIGILINLVVSVVLVNYLGICGVIIGTIAADFFANFMVDPAIIHKFSFKNYKRASYYYAKNGIYFLILFIIGLADWFICTHFVINKGILSLAVHIMICGLSVPCVFMFIYRKTDVCIYLFDKIKFYLLKRGKA